LSLGPNGTWTEKVLYSFTGSDGDGANPYGGLVFDSKGNLYGTTAFIYGTVFELTPGTNDTWTEKVLYRFSGGPDGGLPVSGLILDEAGNLYGTTEFGGAGFGTVFELVKGSGGTWTEKVLHAFTGGNDGSNPYSPLIFDDTGNLYGTTLSAVHTITEPFSN
jgi:hypothetical protein